MSDFLPPELITAAMRLVGAVHFESVAEVNAVLDHVDVRGLAVTLAAMVPDDQSPSELLAWNDEANDRRALCGSCGAVFNVDSRMGRPPATCRACRRAAALDRVVVPERCNDPHSGTDTGYYRHTRGTARQDPTVACRACRAAHAQAEQQRLARVRSRRSLSLVPSVSTKEATG